MKIFLLLALIAVASATKTFYGDQVLTVTPQTIEHVTFLQGLEKTPGLVDFWNPEYADAITANNPVDIHLPKANLKKLKGLMGALGIPYTVKIEELQASIDEQVQGRLKSKAIRYDYNVYHTYEEIGSWLDDMVSKYPSLASKQSLGTTYEGRDIPMLKIGSNENAPSILIDCGIHAREWIAPAFCQCLVRDILEDGIFDSYLSELTFYIIPVLNPDGYSYTWSNDRMWRKTRTRYNNNACIGADPNRNFDALWSGPGSSGVSCTDTYYGVSVESEPCVKALSDFVRSNAQNIKAYLTFHSYGQMILYPYSYTYDAAPNMATLDLYAHQAADAIKAVANTRYDDVGQGASTIYLAAGGSDDFSYDKGVPLSYTIELPDTGLYGFTLPERKISGVCLETVEAVKVFVDAALNV